MMIAGGYAFSVRSLAPARSLFRIHCGGWDVRRFPKLILSLSHQGKAAEMMACRFCVSSLGPFLGPSCDPCSRLVPPSRAFLVHPCRSKQEAAAFFIHPAPHRLPRASPRQILRPVARCLIRFAHPSRSSSRPAVSPSVSFSYRFVSSSRRPSRLARCAARLPPVLRSRRFVQLISPCPHALPSLPSLPPHDRMTQDGHRGPHHGFEANKQEASESQGGGETHAHRDDTARTTPTQEHLITYHQDDKTNEKKNETSKQDAPARR